MSIKNNTTSLQELLEAVNNLPNAGEGAELPTLANEGSASDLLYGKQLIDQDGNVVTGTISTKTSSNLTVSGATVTVPSGYYATQATKSVDTATQATPSISVDSAGKITATATQTAGYVSAGTKSATKQLATQAAKTVTPTKSSQTAVVSGVYTTGTVTVAAIPSQYVDNSSVTAVESDVMNGKKFGANGSVKTGTFSLDTELSEQDSLIAQIQAAVDGLPEAGGGTGGAAIYNTCTLQIDNQSYYNYSLAYTSVENGEIVSKYSTQTSSTSIICLCGSVLCIDAYGSLMSSSIVQIGSLGSTCCAYRIDAFANETVTVDIIGGGAGN